jgi:hypothetical protein
LMNYLFPKKTLTKENIHDLSREILNILRNHKENDGWLFSYDLLDKLKVHKQFRDMEYYNLWYVPYDEIHIERKLIERKDREIGYLRYKG